MLCQRPVDIKNNELIPHDSYRKVKQNVWGGTGRSCRTQYFARQFLYQLKKQAVHTYGGKTFDRQIRESAAQIAARFSKENYVLAYQSRSGLPQDPWLEPDISDSIRALALGKEKSVLAVPVGFVADHVEVLYDLDIKAKKSAEGLGLRFFRAGTVGHHPQFIRMLAQIASSQSVVPSR